MTLTRPAVETPSVAVADLVERWRVAYRLREFAAREFVAWFVEAGLLERVDGERVAVTERGRRLAEYAEQAASE